jgi:hypothetical protein
LQATGGTRREKSDLGERWSLWKLGEVPNSPAPEAPVERPKKMSEKGKGEGVLGSAGKVEFRKGIREIQSPRHWLRLHEGSRM